MKFDFGFSMYFLDGPELSIPEKFFIQVQRKLQVYKLHSEKTVELYNKEFKSRMAAHKQKESEAMAKANEEYRRHYDEIGGNDYDKHSFAVHESGIDELTHHFSTEEQAIKESFTEMADHFNKSAFVTLYALMETELRRCCAHLQTYFEKRISLERFEQSDYFKSILEYLDQVIELETASLKPHITRLVTLQFLRNKIMHNGGEFPVPIPEFLDNVVRTSDDGLWLEDISEENLKVLRVRSRYVMSYYPLVGDLFRQLFEILHEKKGYQYFTDRLTYAFGFLGKDVAVTYKEKKAIKAGNQYTFKIGSEIADGYSFMCKVSFSEASEEKIIVTDQLDTEVENLDRLFAGITDQPHVLKDIMKGLLDPDKMYQFDFLLYPDS